jgi:hypothetical protein
MIYIRKIFTQDLKDGKQIAFPAEPSNIFFKFSYSNQDPDRKISFKFREKDKNSPLFIQNDKTINTRLHSERSESRIDRELTRFLIDDLNAKVDDVIVFRAISLVLYEFELIPQGASLYSSYKALLNNKNHEVALIPFDFENIAVKFNNLDKYTSYFAAIRTKPFVLLAGISGIGKSRIVRELAFMSCPTSGKLQDDETTPGNYCMIEVKPNWHDSSELLGYASGIKEKYIITPFVKFLIKAIRYPKVPFFVCLDEMNLAPVEQYFAEYLSVLETRKMDGDAIVSGSLINKDIFNKYEDNIFIDLGLKTEERTDLENEWENNTAIENELKEFGLRLPQNLIVVGTVNMDDTTHQFSRKVIDRAMTIEMNNVNFEEMFSNEDMLRYVDEPLPYELLIADCASAIQAFEFIPEDAEKLKVKTIGIMQLFDEKLQHTPFRVAYRVQNEMVLYFRNMRFANPGKPFEELFVSTVDAILNMKVLPRIEGDEDLVEKPLKGLLSWCTENGYSSSHAKIKEMLARLERSHYTSYWP